MIIQLIVIQGVIFAAFIFLLRFLFSRNLNAALARLNALHEENLVKEAQLANELKLAKEEREAEVKRGQDEAAQIIEEAKKDGILLRLKMEEDAKGQVERIVIQGNDEVNRLKEAALTTLNNQSLDFAVEMIRQVFTEENKQALHVEFTNDVLREIEKLPPDQFPPTVKSVSVVSSHALQKEQKDELSRILTVKFGFTPVITEATSPDLISGLILDMQGLIIDGTVKNRLRRIIPHLKNRAV